MGKSIAYTGGLFVYDAGHIVWDGQGPDTQHSFHQLLMQGSVSTATDFVFPLSKQSISADKRKMVYANVKAQADVMFHGYSDLTEDEFSNHRFIAGNKASALVLMKDLDPYHLGALIALYEHKVYAQSCIWQINAFDQFGVEAGKKMAMSNSCE